MPQYGLVDELGEQLVVGVQRAVGDKDSREWAEALRLIARMIAEPDAATVDALVAGIKLVAQLPLMLDVTRHHLPFGQRMHEVFRDPDPCEGTDGEIVDLREP